MTCGLRNTISKLSYKYLATVDETTLGSVRNWIPVLLYRLLSPQVRSGLNMAMLTAMELTCSEWHCNGTLLAEKHCPVDQDLVGKSLHRNVADEEWGNIWLLLHQASE